MIPFSERLTNAIQAARTLVMVGLDPRLEELPSSLQPSDPKNLAEVASCYKRFCFDVIDVVSLLVGVVKPQAAFFEQLGPPGMAALADVIDKAIAKGLVVILDAKRGDIGSTAEAYAAAYLGRKPLSSWGADALTVNPYLGDDTLSPFLKQCDKVGGGIFVLVKTSNPGSGFIQDQASGGVAICERVADHVESLAAASRSACGYGDVGAVVGATYPDQLAELRARMPSTWLLVPGFGAQGGTAKDVAGAFDSRGLGGIVNNSRGILFAYRRREYASTFGEKHWQDAVEEATKDMIEQLWAETSAKNL